MSAPTVTTGLRKKPAWPPATAPCIKRLLARTDDAACRSGADEEASTRFMRPAAGSIRVKCAPKARDSRTAGGEALFCLGLSNTCFVVAFWHETCLLAED